MKEIAAVLLAFGLVTGATWLATQQGNDRELMVSPPDAVAEGFVREVTTGRYPRAKEYLAEPELLSNDDLRVLEQQLEAETGDPSEIEAELVNRDDERALVTVRLSSKEGSEAVTYALVFDGEWKIAR